MILKQGNITISITMAHYNHGALIKNEDDYNKEYSCTLLNRHQSVAKNHLANGQALQGMKYFSVEGESKKLLVESARRCSAS